MFNIIPLILILLSLTVMIIIVVRKFSVLANLDIGAIQAEREAKTKERIVGTRIKRNVIKYYSKVTRVLQPVGQIIANFLKSSYKKLIDFKDNYNKNEKINSEKTIENVAKLLADAEDSINQGDIDSAENKYIEVIGLDSKNIKAFRGLGGLYFEKKNYSEAKETLEHVLRLLEKDFDEIVSDENSENIEDNNSQIAGIYFNLSQISDATKNFKEALEYINKALKIEPNNPRYLDTKVEISIINKDKLSALDAYEKLRTVNPENKKLKEIKDQIKEL